MVVWMWCLTVFLSHRYLIISKLRNPYIELLSVLSYFKPSLFLIYFAFRYNGLLVKVFNSNVGGQWFDSLIIYSFVVNMICVYICSVKSILSSKKNNILRDNGIIFLIKSYSVLYKQNSLELLLAFFIVSYFECNDTWIVPIFARFIFVCTLWW